MKVTIAIACAMLSASACAAVQDSAPPAADGVIYMPAPPPVEGMDAPRCYVTESVHGSRLQLRLVRTHAAKWIRVTGDQRTGEGEGAWQPGGDTITLDAFNATDGMPTMPKAFLKHADGSLVAKGIGRFVPTECWPLKARAYELPMATIQVPDGMDVTERSDTRDFGTGKPGMYAIVEPPDQGGVLALISVIYADADEGPMDLPVEAVEVANPQDRSLAASAVVAQRIGGLPGAKYDATVRVGDVPMRTVGYAVEYNGCRVTAKVQGEGASEELVAQLAAAFESLQWKPGVRCTPNGLSVRDAQ